jgi:hypothetical protein
MAYGPNAFSQNNTSKKIFDIEDRPTPLSNTDSIQEVIPSAESVYQNQSTVLPLP